LVWHAGFLFAGGMDDPDRGDFDGGGGFHGSGFSLFLDL
jgi:hypothetical protein